MLDARQYFSFSAAVGCTNPLAATAVTAVIATTVTAAAAAGVTPPNEVSRNYTVDICANSAATPPAYLITATPFGGQLAQDKKCGAVTLNQAGTKGQKPPATPADCW